MKITKFGHSCLLVEMPAPVNRTALFDPGVFSTVHVEKLKYLDDIFVTHSHADHMSVDLIKELQQKFPNVRITAPNDAKTQLDAAGVKNVTTIAPEGVRFFDAPHEVIRPYFDVAPPDELGIHYLDLLTHPGDSHHFTETMPILALPVTVPWGSIVNATKLGIELRPPYIIPIHDWHWRPEALTSAYDTLEQRFKEHGITFLKMVDGEPLVIDW